MEQGDPLLKWRVLWKGDIFKGGPPFIELTFKRGFLLGISWIDLGGVLAIFGRFGSKLIQGILVPTHEDPESKIGSRSHIKCILTSFSFLPGDLLYSYYT